MAIWAYADNARNPDASATLTACPYCETSLDLLFRDWIKGDSHNDDFETLSATICQTCGWWQATRRTGIWTAKTSRLPKYTWQTFAQAGALMTLDLTDLTLPLDEVRSYLCAQYESRRTMHPRLFEETVGSVFRNLGYQALVTAYSGDNGIDVVLVRGQEKIGVQVKKWKNAIKAEQIDALAGALMRGRYVAGMFVTTSHFQPAAVTAAAQHGSLGHRIELVDAQRFYDALKLSQRPHYASKDEFLATHDLGNMPRVAGSHGR